MVDLFSRPCFFCEFSLFLFNRPSPSAFFNFHNLYKQILFSLCLYLILYVKYFYSIQYYSKNVIVVKITVSIKMSVIVWNLKTGRNEEDRYFEMNFFMR